MHIIFRGCIMNRKGFISTAALYSFFLVFCLLLILIMTTYTNNRVNYKMVKNDAKNWAYEKSSLKNRYTSPPENPVIKPPVDPNPTPDPDPIIPDIPDDIMEGYKKVIIDNGDGNSTYEESISFIKNKGIPDFKTVSTSDDGMYSTSDNFGTSYYFRGAVDDNWVKYGINKNGYEMYWRIIRINGDNTIRMIYSGINAPTVNQSDVMTGADTAIGTSAYNSSLARAEYVGFMYASGSQHNNSTSSLIKTKIDNWFETTSLKNDSNLANGIFCNDRSTSSSNWSSKPSSTIYYNTNIRASSSNPIPKLWCENNKDMLSSGSDNITYPVGLITVDEIILAGGNVLLGNSNYYLYTGTSYYTLSPFYVLKGPDPYVFTLSSNGKITADRVTTSVYVRPVINLSSNVKFTGTGTYDDVYEVVE